MFSSVFLSKMRSATSILAVSSVFLGTNFISPTHAMEDDLRGSFSSSLNTKAVPSQIESPLREKQPLGNVPLTQTHSIFKSIGNASFTEESLENFLKTGAEWLKYQAQYGSPTFARDAAKKILMLEKIEAENPNSIPVYSGTSYFINALNDLSTALYRRINKMEKKDQYVFRSPEYFKSSYGKKEILDLFAKNGENEFDRDPEFIQHAMCVTFSLLSTIEIACESTLAFWSDGDSYAVKEDQIATLLGNCVKAITGDFLPPQIIKEKTTELLKATPKTGVLYQFFIDPKAVDPTLLVTRAWGVPLTSIDEYSKDNPTLEFMRDVRRQPDHITQYMSAHSESFKETCSVWRQMVAPANTSVEDCPLIDVTLPRVQGRLIVNPQDTMDPQKFTIKKHYWHPVNQEDLSKYEATVESFVNWIVEEKIKRIQQTIDGVSRPNNPWVKNPYTKEVYPDREEALTSLRLEYDFYLSR